MANITSASDCDGDGDRDDLDYTFQTDAGTMFRVLMNVADVTADH
jgi:hypothetical protein